MVRDPNPYSKHGRHHRLNQQHDSSRYWLRQGMARVALEAKVTGKPAEDSVGRPLLYANELAQRQSTKTIQRWADGRSTLVSAGGMDFCPTCHHVPTDCRCPHA